MFSRSVITVNIADPSANFANSSKDFRPDHDFRLSAHFNNPGASQMRIMLVFEVSPEGLDMPRFFGSNIEQKTVLNRQILKWLERLPDEFDVFVELEGSDFQVDFLVFKQHGIFDIEAKNWRVKEARLDAHWDVVVDTRIESRSDPFIQVLDQCAKVRDYILYQRHEIFGPEKAGLVEQFATELKIFPVIALSNPYGSTPIFHHVYRKVFTDAERLVKHLKRFAWFPNTGKPFAFEREDVKRLARLFHLKQFNPQTLKPLPQTTKPAVRVTSDSGSAGPAAARASSRSATGANPYQYTYAVTGNDFYGREEELWKIKRALQGAPPKPVMIIGLQRTGKSSLALESIRQLTANSDAYTKLEFDFRSLRNEGFSTDRNLTLHFLSLLANGSTGSEIDSVIQQYAQRACKSDVLTQRTLFKAALQKNADRGKRTILFLDECHEVKEFLNTEPHATFFSYLDSLCRDPNLRLHVVLACRPGFLDLTPIREINLGRLFEVINLGLLKDKPAREIIDRGRATVEFTESARNRILFLTGRHPFWLQSLCYRLLESAFFNNRSEVDVSDVNRVFEHVVKDPGCKPQFLLLYQEIENEGEAYDLLKAVSEAASVEGEAIELTALGNKWGENNKLRAALSPLIDNQILTIENVPQQPAVRFQVEALRAWMRPNLVTL